MKIKFKEDENCAEDEVVIHCQKITNQHLQLQQMAEELLMGKRRVKLYHQGKEYFIPMDEIYFFETDGTQVYAHTADKHYLVKQKLYELQQELPSMFFRTAKSMIINLDLVSSVTKNLTSSSIVDFYNTPKKSYVSRRYYKMFNEFLNERRRYLK